MDKKYKPTTLEGSCHCGKVKFTVDSYCPSPFMICHCITDTKTAGRYNINIQGEANTLKIEGEEYINTYQAVNKDKEGNQILSSHERKFCKHCASYLYAFDKKYPEWIYPFLTAIDTQLKPVSPENQYHIFCDFKKTYNPIEKGVLKENMFSTYPIKDEPISLKGWHEKHGLYGIGDEAISKD